MKANERLYQYLVVIIGNYPYLTTGNFHRVPNLGDEKSTYRYLPINLCKSPPISAASAHAPTFRRR